MVEFELKETEMFVISSEDPLKELDNAFQPTENLLVFVDGLQMSNVIIVRAGERGYVGIANCDVCTNCKKKIPDATCPLRFKRGNVVVVDNGDLIAHSASTGI
jgi:hypothetical protein